jgi:hypothetical protein
MERHTSGPQAHVLEAAAGLPATKQVGMPRLHTRSRLTPTAP